MVSESADTAKSMVADKLPPRDALARLVAAVEAIQSQAMAHDKTSYRVDATLVHEMVTAKNAALGAADETTWQNGIEWVRVPRSQWDEVVDLRARLQAVEAERDDQRDDAQVAWEACWAAQRGEDEARAQATALAAALEEYGQHGSSCHAYCHGNDDHGSHRIDGHPCTCGLDQALNAVKNKG